MNIIQRQFYALDSEDIPEIVVLDGTSFQKVQTFKYDYFAGTGLYHNGDDQVVVKIYRTRSFFGIPMRWLGKISVKHEAGLYQLLNDVRGIPRYRGRVEKTGFVHEFIPGHPLRKGDDVSDSFFDEFKGILQRLHSRHIAYVDLNKSENILLGDDGNPYLVDLQISYHAKTKIPLFSQLSRFIARQLQTEDWYHYSKHKRRLRPDLLTPDDYARTYKRSIGIRIHRVITKPYFIIRHFIMDLLELEPAE
jgi:hypothetical protein